MSYDGVNLISEAVIKDADDDDVRGGDGDMDLRDRAIPDEPEGFVDPAAVEALGKIPGAMAQAQRGSGVARKTGPKGVITDFHAAESAAHHARLQKQALDLRRLKQMCVTVDPSQGLAADESSDADSDDLDALERELLGEDVSAEGEEDEFLKQYRRKRMQELQAAAIPTYGWLHTVTPLQFVPAIDEEPPSVTVIVHLFEDHIRPCSEMNRCLRAIARRHPAVKFVAMRASSTRDAGEAGWDESTLPILLVYRGGDLVESFMKITEPQMLGPSFDEDSVEVFLRKHELLG